MQLCSCWIKKEYNIAIQVAMWIRMLNDVHFFMQ